MLPSEITNKKILISPLDWGMGHTTRCVVLIRTLLANSNQIIFAGNYPQIDFIKREFPAIETEFLEGYNIRLDSQKSPYLQLLTQFKKINSTMINEQNFVEEMCRSKKIDLVISDNRYGFRSKNVTSIFVTHQLRLQIPFGKWLVNRKIKKWVEKFDQCWIPDDAKKPICGELIKAKLKIPTTFIGHLSRFKEQADTVKYKYLGIISGPEPERSRFKEMLIQYLEKQDAQMALIGTSGYSANIDFFEDPSTDELQVLLDQSGKVISRAGYTTIMEMTAINKSAILIPTPKQYEQQYLAQFVKVQGIEFRSENDFFGGRQTIR